MTRIPFWKTGGRPRAVKRPKTEYFLNRIIRVLFIFFRHLPLMSMLQNDIFATAEQRLAWTSERQAVLARNIANLSTPGFQASDTKPFHQVLGGLAGVQPMRTNDNHLKGTVDPGLRVRTAKEGGTRTADKNGVRMEEQLMKVADTETLHSTVTAIYKKYMTMFGIALGRPA